MAANVIEKKIGAGLDLKDLGLLAGAKILTERLTKNHIGNATLKSGLIKMGGAVAISLFVKQRQVRFMAAGAGLDGAEDLFQVAFDKVGITHNKNNVTNGGFNAVL